MGKRRFWATIKGEGKTEASRGGNEASGISSHTRGWNIGIEVGGHIDGLASNNRDQFDVYLTGGSNGGKRMYVGTAMLVNGEPTFVPSENVI
jgi:hypothetical protein